MASRSDVCVNATNNLIWFVLQPHPLHLIGAPPLVHLVVITHKLKGSKGQIKSELRVSRVQQEWWKRIERFVGRTAAMGEIIDVELFPIKRNFRA